MIKINKICGIYCIENIINKKRYIGQSRDAKMRFYGHKSELRRNVHGNEHLQRAWNKYGEENFIFYIIKECKLIELDECEKYYIDYYNTFDYEDGYNIELGGNGNNKEIPQSTRDKISKNHADVSGENNPMFGLYIQKKLWIRY